MTISSGFSIGVLFGILAGFAECVLCPLALPLRVAYTVAADALLGGAWGAAAAAALAGLGGLRGSDREVRFGRIVGVVSFVPLAAALGILVNRGLLRDVHHLEPMSLGMDVVALVAAATLAVVLGRVSRRLALLRALALAERPAFAGIAGVACVGLVALPSAMVDSAAPGPARPSIILLSIDTLRPDQLGTGGSPRGTSPEIDRLCREGVQWPDAIAVSPGSGASHAALLTSRYPISNGVHTNFSILDDSVTTLAETLRTRGYRTGGFVTNMFLGRRFGFTQGFDSYVQTGVVERLQEVSPAVLWRSLAIVHIVDHVRSVLQPGYDPSFITALAWIRESRRPTFFFLHLMDVHEPYVAPSPWDRHFNASRDGTPAWTGEANPFGWRPSEETYRAEIRFADAKIGRLRDRLEEIGILDESVVVVTSDHGENLLDHEPHFSHGTNQFDSTLRIVAAVRAPRRAEPGIDARLLENVDLLPSVASLVDLPRHDEWEGRDLFDPTIEGRRAAYSQLYRDFVIRAQDVKFVLGEDGSRAVFHLDVDPGEKTPLTPTADELRHAEADLQRWFDEHVTNLYAREGGEVAPEELSPEAVATLRTLGYLD